MSGDDLKAWAQKKTGQQGTDADKAEKHYGTGPLLRLTGTVSGAKQAAKALEDRGDEKAGKGDHGGAARDYEMAAGYHHAVSNAPTSTQDARKESFGEGVRVGKKAIESAKKAGHGSNPDNWPRDVQGRFAPK